MLVDGAVAEVLLTGALAATDSQQGHLTSWLLKVVKGDIRRDERHWRGNGKSV
jgi:hypothetical protein